MADLERLARAQRRELLDVDAELARLLVESYQRAWVRLRDQVDALAARIQAARDAGEDVDAGWLAREERLRALEQSIVREVTQVARSANGAISDAQWRVIRMAQEHAGTAIEAAMGEPPAGVSFAFQTLNPGAVRALVGTLRNGRPLGALLEELGPAAATSARAALTDGVILGEGPAAIARRMRAAFGGNAVRSVTIARDAVLTGYNEAARLSYEASGVVAGWRWLCARSTRTCGYCWAQDGRVFPLDEPMPRHPRCRCTCVPELLPEFAGPPSRRPSGPAAFARLPEADQRRVLGPAKLAALKAGAIDLVDLVGTKDAGAWGTVGYERSLTSVVGAERARALIAGSHR